MRAKVEIVRKDSGTRVTSEKELKTRSSSPSPTHSLPESMPARIQRVKEDLHDLQRFYNIALSPTRKSRLKRYYNQQLVSLQTTNFTSYDQGGRVDYLLIQNYLRRNLRQVDLDDEKDRKMGLVLPFASVIIKLCEDRQMMKVVDGKVSAEEIFSVRMSVLDLSKKIRNGEVEMDKNIAFRAANTVGELRVLLAEWFAFFKRYDPIFSWWVSGPYERLEGPLNELGGLIKEKLVGIKPGDEYAIVGEPIGREGLLADLEAEMIPYSPEEVVEIGELEYVWCEKEMKKASSELGYDDWRDALEYVKNLYVPPGEQTQLVKLLSDEATEYVKKHDLITVPPICEETWRMFMMSPARQRINPFFLGGDSIIVSYPDDTMDHDEKLMSMRGNNIHFSRATVFHEMIPGHHLQFHSIARYKPYRIIFDTPFWMEGWAFYWEMILWDDNNFPKTPENRIGMLFWRMHRCARIIFSIKFHLRQMTPQECIDLLVQKVGHERATAEGEVRRSFNGDYTPLYQAGYMLGALQIYSLRKEVLESGWMTEKEFHDRVMQENNIPIEMLRASILEQKVTPDFKTSWRFYESHRK